jgi:predicted nuclease with TOPRIM domain
VKNQRKPLKIPNNEAKDGSLQKANKRIKRLEKENARLRSDLNAYDQAFRKTTKFLKDHTDQISINDLIEGAKQDKSLKEVKPVCPKCLGEISSMTIPAGEVTFCINIECDYREVKK